MKKLLTSALLTGLLLGATTPVFAATGTAVTDGADTIVGDSSTPVTSSIKASYTVTIPSTLLIEKAEGSNGFTTSKGDVLLTDLTAAGKIAVTAEATDLTLQGGTSKNNETLTTKLTNGVSTEELPGFDLEVAVPQQVQVETAESSSDNLPGTYTGSVNFTFDYVPDIAE